MSRWEWPCVHEACNTDDACKTGRRILGRHIRIKDLAMFGFVDLRASASDACNYGEKGRKKVRG